MYIQKRNLLVSALCSDMMLQSNLPNMWTPQGKSQVSTLQGCLLQSNVLNTDTKGTEPTLQTEVSVLQSNHLNTDTKGTESSVHITKVFVLQSNLHNTDTKGTESSGHITEVSILKYVALFHLN